MRRVCTRPAAMKFRDSNASCGEELWRSVCLAIARKPLIVQTAQDLSLLPTGAFFRTRKTTEYHNNTFKMMIYFALRHTLKLCPLLFRPCPTDLAVTRSRVIWSTLLLLLADSVLLISYHCCRHHHKFRLSKDTSYSSISSLKLRHTPPPSHDTGRHRSRTRHCGDMNPSGRSGGEG